MNIFKALSQGNGQISETNITSFLSFLLNESNEFGSAFLIIFIENLNRIEECINIKGNSYRKKIQYFNENYTFSAVPEVRLQYENRVQIVDTIVTISNKFNDKDLLYILVENKIKKSAIKKEQCFEQFEVFKFSDDFQNNVPTYSILITPPEKAFEEMYNSVLNINNNSTWFSWTDNSINLVSIESFIRKMIYLENNLEIAPINIISKYILKSFIEYLSNEFSEKTKEFNYSVLSANIIEIADFIIDKKKYILKRFSNKMIRVYDDENNLLNEDVKPILRRIINDYRLNIEFENKNTQILGRDVIRCLNELK